MIIMMTTKLYFNIYRLLYAYYIIMMSGYPAFFYYFFCLLIKYSRNISDCSHFLILVSIRSALLTNIKFGEGCSLLCL